MSVDAICAKLWSTSTFKQRYLSLQIEGAEELLAHALEKQVKTEDRFFWTHMLRCASIFINSDKEEYYEAGLRIIQNAVQFAPTAQARNFGGALLAKMANRPALSLAVSRGLVRQDLLAILPTQFKLEVAAQEIGSTINFERPNSFVGNRFQTKLWDTLENNDWISASAPTSAGKSFLLEKWIEQTISSTGAATIFYIVPTRALIGQVEKNLRAIFKERLASDLSITSLPLHFVNRKPHQIYIYTQERFHLYLLSHTAQHADLIVIDEAHKIGGGKRGVLLQQVLELATQNFPIAKFLFASPSTQNPEALLRFSPSGRKAAAVSDQIPTVNQNLFWLIQAERKPKDWLVDILIDGDRHTVGKLHLSDKPSQGQKLAFLSFHIGGSESGNVIYVNTASEAEKTAELIHQNFSDSDDIELNNLSELCEKAVHPQFLLKQYVKRGVAFHYGNIPQLVRFEIERLFSSGKIKYLVCTSTLIEGMNLACRNVFMRHPKRGMKELMQIDDFWNLAGRAGRWGKEFQGNVFCIDPLKEGDWIQGHAPKKKIKQHIEIATSRAVHGFAALLKYLENWAGPSIAGEDRYHEQLLSYFVFRKTLFGDIGQAFTGTSIRPDQIALIDAAVLKVISQLTVPISIVQRNPGIDPRNIENLYKSFQSRDPEKIAELVPADPLSSDAVNSYLRVFSRVTEHLGSARLGRGASAFGNALLVVNWMRGWPLARIIDGQIKYEERRAKDGGEEPPPKPTVIRSTMEKVETVARFEAPKYLHCYIDVLNHFLQEVGQTELLKDVQDLWVFLEFGVSKRTELSLMALGLSRSSTMALSEFIKDDNLDEVEVFSWLQMNDWRSHGFARIVEIEIEKMIEDRGAEFTPPAN